MEEDSISITGIIVNIKVLIANSHIPWGGLGQYSINLAKSLSKEGYDVYGLVTHNKDDLYGEFSEATIRTYYLGDYGKIAKYYNCIRTINDLKPQIIIINYLATIQFILPFIRQSIVLSVIHSDQNDYYRIASINKRYVNQWIAPSLRVRNGFIQYLKSNKLSEKISIIPHGVEISTNPSRNVNQGTFQIAFIGALYKHKGVDLLPEIFHSFYSQCPDCKLTIIGEGDLDQFLKEKFSAYSFNGIVNFIGVVKNQEVREYLKQADVLLFPTRVESFGLVIVEAMMEGAVPVVTKLNGITEMIINNEEDGFLAGKDNINDFVERLKHLYEDRILLHKMSVSAKEKAYTKFNIKTMAETYSKMITHNMIAKHQ